MSSSARSARLRRRAFLIALGVIPATTALVACSRNRSVTLTGVDMRGEDHAIRPQDDLFRYVNGGWLRDYQLPPDKSSYSTFDEVSDRVERQLREIVAGIREPKAGSTEQQIRDLYDARLDIDTIEKLGTTPLADLFTAIDGAAHKADLARVMGALPIGGLIDLAVEVDQKNSAAYVATVSQSGIDPHMGEQYYRKPQYAEQRAAYKTYLERVAAGAGFTDPAGTAQRVFDLETRIAAAFWDDVRLRNPDAAYNPMSWAELTALAPQFDWDPWLAGNTDRPHALFDKVVVGQPSFVTAAGQLWAEVDIAAWQEYLRLAVVKHFASLLPKAIADAEFDFVGKTLRGLTQRQEPWKDGIATVNANLGQQLGKLYVREHFPPSAKERALAMVADLISAYRADFTDSTWMSPPTRQAAIAKLDKIVTKIGYPDKWIDYSGLTITRGKLLESVRAAETFEAKRGFARLGIPVDKSEWVMPPQMVNAMYDPSANSISFPAAILQPPFFDKDAAAAVNYGAIGAIIGHEIGHGFDDQGSRYDGDGNLRDWWTPADRAAFEVKTKQLIEQYNALVPAGLDPSKHVDGALTVGENLADLRGLGIALAALGIADKRDGKDDPDHRTMFLSWARIWRDKSTPQQQELRLAMDVHAPNEFRCNQVVRNIDEFYPTFDVQAGDKLFLAQDQRVSL
ncbi:M13 family metallopeptidase [Nocardia sp. NBC_00565]|uniref:M13 family metallopeptidase n=1 Tax=Nocardia sp. NBC_00565 TaxID=2975993 RepID=UPI002E81AE77|nr:M13 family metallopeptidase [Nocardia sp. NBC_00565]WUC02840.1 M13 family metallopeptidase [Nocardia sp. NBC_00565]